MKKLLILAPLLMLFLSGCIIRGVNTSYNHQIKIQEQFIRTNYSHWYHPGVTHNGWKRYVPRHNRDRFQFNGRYSN